MTEEVKRCVVWRFPSEDLDALDRPLSWSGWMNVYMKRWQYWPPWGVVKPWKPRVADACDETGRASKILIIPPLGAFAFFFKNRKCGHHFGEEGW